LLAIKLSVPAASIPACCLKVFVFAYIANIYSSRKIEEALQQHICFMSLSRMTTPDPNTINCFRGERLKDVLRNIFTQVVQLLAQEGLLSIKEQFTDGTRIEGSANRYTFVWGNAIKASKKKVKKQLDELWQYPQKLAAEEMDDTDPSGFHKIDSGKVEQTFNQLNEALKGKGIDSKVKPKINYAK
jgi:hypothetical protein